MQRFAEFLFDFGKWFGAWSRPEVRTYFCEHGMTEAEIKALEKALEPMLRVIYKDR